MVVVVVTIFVAFLRMIPAMIVGDHTAIPFPMTDIVVSIAVIRLHPIRTLVRRPRPVAVVPRVVTLYRILVTLDPHVIRARACRDAIRPRRRRRLTDMDVEGHLSSRSDCECREEGGEHERLEAVSHAGLQSNRRTETKRCTARLFGRARVRMRR